MVFRRNYVVRDWAYILKASFLGSQTFPNFLSAESIKFVQSCSIIAPNIAHIQMSYLFGKYFFPTKFFTWGWKHQGIANIISFLLLEYIWEYKRWQEMLQCRYGEWQTVHWQLGASANNDHPWLGGYQDSLSHLKGIWRGDLQDGIRGKILKNKFKPSLIFLNNHLFWQGKSSLIFRKI